MRKESDKKLAWDFRKIANPFSGLIKNRGLFGLFRMTAYLQLF